MFTYHSQQIRPENQLISGYTLIELLVTLTIVSIIASSAIPAYSAYTISSRQTFAITTISKISLALEKYFTEYLTYETDLATLQIAEHDQWFQYSIVDSEQYRYQIDATPKQGSRISTIFRIDHLGRQFHRNIDHDQWITGWP